jgi:hypothetical protein
MGKTIGKLALIAGVIALNFIPGVGTAVGLALTSAGLSAAAVTAGATILTSLAIGAGIGLASEVLIGQSKVSAAQLSALTLSFNPLAPRTVALGTGILSTDVAYWEPSGTNQEYADYIIVNAAHEVDGFDQIFTESNLLWSAGTIQPAYIGYATVDLRTVGTSSNGIAINGGSTWTSACTLTGCAYLRLRIKRTGASSKASSPFSGGLPANMRIIGRGAKLYDPRQDSTVGGSGPMRATDQATWSFAGIGDNHALQALTYLLGWRTGGVVSVGVGMPPTRLDYADWITAANICDETVTLQAGGTQRRYEGGGVFADTDAPTSVLASLCTHMNAELRDVTGKLGIRIAHNDLSGTLTSFTADDIIGQYERGFGEALNSGFNALRGQISDPSTASLYQLAPYSPVKIASIDGIDRPSTLDLPLCHSTERAQRIATQVLIRKQYQDIFTADFGPRMWAKRMGDPVALTFAPCGFVNQKLRILSMENRVVMTDGDAQQFCTCTLQVDDPAVYAWTPGTATLPASAVPVVPYNPLNSPLALIALADINTAESAKLSGIEKNATRNLDAVLSYSMAYPTVAEFNVDFTTSYAAPAIIATTDRGGHAVRLDGPGTLYPNKGLPFDNSVLYAVEFDLEVLNTNGVLYLGVVTYNAAGAAMASDNGSSCYFAAAAFSSVVGRKTYTGYFRGSAAVGAGNNVGAAALDATKPGIVPSGTVTVQPVCYTSYGVSNGSAVLHAVTLRPIQIASGLSRTLGGGNLVFNSSYDAGTTGFGPYNNSAVAEPFTVWGYSAGDGRRGNNALQVSWAVANTSTKGFYAAVPFRPYSKYVVSFYVKSAALFGAPMILTFGWNTPPILTTPLTSIAMPAAGAGYVRVVYALEFGATADSVLYVTAGNAGYGTVFFADVQVEEGDFVTGYSPMAPSTAANLAYPSGPTVASLQPQEANANNTESRTAADFAGRGDLARRDHVRLGLNMRDSADTTVLGDVDVITSRGTANDTAFVSGEGSGALRGRVTSAATTAAWSGVSGAGRPADFADVTSTAAVITQGSIAPTVPSDAFTFSTTTSSATFSWPAFTIYRANGTTMSIASGSQTVSGLVAGVTYRAYPYAVDVGGTTGVVAFAGGGSGTGGYVGASTQQPAMAAAMVQTGNIPLGPISFATPTSGSGGGAGGGSFCVCVESHLPSGGVVRDARVGDDLFLLRGDDSGFFSHPVERVELALADCVRLTTSSGITLICSLSTPITSRGGRVVTVADALGVQVPILDQGIFGWDAIAAIDAVGVRRVSMISADNGTYAAGERADDRFIFTHNYTAKP